MWPTLVTPRSWKKTENLTLGERQGGNHRQPGNGYRLVTPLQIKEETNQKDYKPDSYTWNLKPCVKQLSEHDRVMNTEQAQSNGEKQLQTISQKCKLLWLLKAKSREEKKHTDLKGLSK